MKAVEDGARAGFLRQQSMSVKEIAYMSGYTQPNDFTRTFRNFSGKLPSAERKEGDPAPTPPPLPAADEARRSPAPYCLSRYQLG